MGGLELSRCFICWQGTGGMTLTEYKTMFTLWCIVKSPLILGSDLRTMEENDEAYKIITNKDLLAINQDSLGIQAKCVKNCCSHQAPFGGIDTSKTCIGFRRSLQVWSGPLSNGGQVMVFLNRYDIHLTNITIDLYKDAKIPVGNYHVKNLWPDQAAEDAGFTSEEAFVVSGNAGSNFTISNIEAHAVVALRFDR